MTNGMFRTVLACALLCTAAGARADTGRQLPVAASAPQVAATLQHPAPEQMLAGSLGKEPVRDASGTEIGDVQGALLTFDGRVEALLVGVGGVMGLGERLVAVRFEHVTFSMEDGARVVDLDLTKAELDAAPVFQP